MASFKIVLQKVSRRSMYSLRTLCSQKMLTLDNHHGTSHGRGQFKSLIRLYSLDAESTGKILTQSTLIVQDGVDIEELPILIKRATYNTFPFTSHSYSGEKFQGESEFDTTFRQDLHNCYSVNEVFKLLEVPSEKVRGLSASMALQRLHVLKYLNTDWNQIHSFIRSAVMRELYDTVQRDVGYLSNSTLISLVECYLAAEGFSPMCIEAVNNEIQSRLGDETFNIEELLNLAHILKLSKDSGKKHTPFFLGIKSSPVSVVSENSSRFLSNDDGDGSPMKVEHFDRYSSKMSPEVRDEIKVKCSELLDNVWIHLTSRYQDVDEQTLPLVLQACTSDRKEIIKLLEKPLARCWTRLSAADVKSCLDQLVHLRTHNTAIMTHFGRWAYVNIHLVTPQLLLSFLNTFINFGFLDENLVKVMERCLSLKGSLVQTDVVAMSLEYCRSCSYLSPLVMDAAASHFTHYAYSYEPLQLFVVLRAFGQLHYLPSQSSAFLKKVESCLWDRFDHLQEAHLLEVLGSFTFLDILPQNFFSRLSREDFFQRVANLPNTSRTTAVMWLKVLKQALALSVSQDADRNFEWLLNRKNSSSLSLYHDSQSYAMKVIRSTIDELLGQQYYHILPIYGCCAVYLNSDRCPLEIKRNEAGGKEILGKVDKKLVILLRSSEHFTVNTRQLLGAHAQRLRHLMLLGFVPVEVRASHLMFTFRGSGDEGCNLIRSALMPYIDFSKVKGSSNQDTQTADIPDPYRSWLGYGTDCDSISGVDEAGCWPESQKDKSVLVKDSGLLTSKPGDDNGGIDGENKDKPV